MHNLTTLIKRYVVFSSPTYLSYLWPSPLQQLDSLSLAKMVQSALTKLVCRLEAATSRLEDMAQATIDPSVPTSGVLNTSRTAVAAAGGVDRDGDNANAQNHAPEPLPPALDDFDSLINGDVVKFVNMSEELGGLVAEQVRVIE